MPDENLMILFPLMRTISFNIIALLTFKITFKQWLFYFFLKFTISITNGAERRCSNRRCFFSVGGSGAQICSFLQIENMASKDQ